MKMIVGATWRARLNSRAICCSLSPYHLLEQVGRFGGDEVRLRLARRRLGEQGLAGARRAVEQEALGRANAEPAERLGMLERQLDAFAQPVAGGIEAADIVPADRRRFDHHLAHGGGLDPLQRILEVAKLDRQRVQDLGRDGLLRRG